MITSVVNLRPLTALRNGMTYTIPIIIVGSLFFLFAHFPVDYIAQWIDKTGFSMYFTQVYQATFDVIAFWIVFAIAYAYAKEEQGLWNDLMNTVTLVLLSSVISIIIQIDTVWTGAEGILGAVTTGLIIGWGYARLVRLAKGWKQREKIPENVWQSFTSLIPIITAEIGPPAGSAVFQHLFRMTVVQGVWTYVQLPIQSFIDTLFGVLLLGFLFRFYGYLVFMDLRWSMGYLCS
ncbi:hypothetical protein EfmAA242_26790 [Enterococcus faecium]|nr:hypothetical protein EfmAA242_26790 [Enterococcus faecium]